MNINKQNLHMEKTKNLSTIQVTIDTDRNVPDTMPDISKVLITSGDIRITECKVTDGELMIKGVLLYTYLYKGNDCISNLSGEIPFEEKTAADLAKEEHVKVIRKLTHLEIESIHSRKIGIRAILELTPVVENRYEEEVVCGVSGAGTLQMKHKQLTTTQLMIDRNDHLKISEEPRLTSQMPNMVTLLYSMVKVCELDFIPARERLCIKGELSLFVLYEGDGDEELYCYETKIPVNTEVTCTDITDTMVPFIQYDLADWKVEIREDEDGEDRILGLDLCIHMQMKFYEECMTQVIEDAYDTREEVSIEATQGHYHKLVCKERIGCTKEGRFPLKELPDSNVQVCALFGNLIVDEMSVDGELLTMEGAVVIKGLYKYGDENCDYDGIDGVIPFEMTYTLSRALSDYSCMYENHMLSLTYSINKNKEIVVIAQIGMTVCVFEQCKDQFIRQLSICEHSSEQLEEMPGMVGYVVNGNETLWDIGKKYRVDIEQIKETNELVQDTLKQGQKLLLVKC